MSDRKEGDPYKTVSEKMKGNTNAVNHAMAGHAYVSTSLRIRADLKALIDDDDASLRELVEQWAKQHYGVE